LRPSTVEVWISMFPSRSGVGHSGTKSAGGGSMHGTMRSTRRTGGGRPGAYMAPEHALSSASARAVRIEV
jgi:hypothetical protein